MQTYFDKVLEGVLKRAPMYGSTPETIEFMLYDHLTTELVIDRGFTWEHAREVAMASVRKVQSERRVPLPCYAFNEREWASLEEFAPVIVSDVRQARKLAHEAPTGEMAMGDPRWIFDKAWQYVVVYCPAYTMNVPQILTRSGIQVTLIFNDRGVTADRYHHDKWWGFVSLEEAQAKVQELWDGANRPLEWELWKKAYPWLEPGKQAPALEVHTKKQLLKRKAEIEAELAVVETRLAENSSK